jgi:hypothetical protein
MTTDNNINVPPTKDEVDAWINSLTEADKAELKRRQLEAAAVNRKPDTAPDLARMSDAEFRDFKRSLGIG